MRHKNLLLLLSLSLALSLSLLLLLLLLLLLWGSKRLSASHSDFSHDL